MELVRDILVSLSAIAVVVIGAFGLSAWKSELKGRERFNIVKNIMSTVLRLRWDFEVARNPFSSSVEYTDRKQQENESADKAMALNLWYAKNRRLKPLTENLQKLVETGWEASVILDDEAAKKVRESITIFRSSYGDLASAVDELCSVELDIADGKTTHLEQDKWIKEMKAVVYSRSNDDFSKRINTTVEELTLVLGKYVYHEKTKRRYMGDSHQEKKVINLETIEKHLSEQDSEAQQGNWLTFAAFGGSIALVGISLLFGSITNITFLDYTFLIVLGVALMLFARYKVRRIKKK